MPLLDEPARDAFVEVTQDGDPYLTDELYVNGDENHVPDRSRGAEATSSTG